MTLKNGGEGRTQEGLEGGKGWRKSFHYILVTNPALNY